MLGHFDIALLDARPYKDEDFQVAIREGVLDQLLEKLPRDMELKNQNAISHWTVPYLFQMLMSGPAGPGIPFTTDNSGLVGVCLMDLASEPTFSETYTQTLNYYNSNLWECANCIGATNAAKVVINGSIESYLLAKDTQGREAVFFRDRWLFLPSEAISPSIRSVGLWGNSGPYNAVSFYTYGITWGRFCRVRLKDSGGNPVTINKLGTQAMVVDYTFTLVSI